MSHPASGVSFHARAIRRWLCLTVIGLLLAQAARPIQAAIRYDAPAALLADETLPGAQNGHTGVWTYGGYDPSFRVFTPFTAAQHIDNWPLNLPNPPPLGTFQGYGTVAGDQTPSLTVNTDTNNARVPCCDMTAVSPGKFEMHPSSPGGNNFGDVYDVPVVRWTAPEAGLITLTARWVQRHSNPQQAMVFTNGVTMFVGLASTGAGTTFVVPNLAVTSGETLDVGVAPGPGQYFAGTTEVDMLIDFTALTPRPILITSQPTNLVVAESMPAGFAVAVTNFDVVQYQWQRNDLDIPQATNATWTIPVTPVTEDGASFRCVITNAVSTNVSAAAILTVLADRTPPALVSVQNDNATALAVLFSEPLAAVSATNQLNYALNLGVTITTAALEADGRTVRLSVTPLALGAAHTLTVNNVRDRAAAANVIATNSQIVFIPTEYRARDIGNPPQATVISLESNGQTMTVGGQDIGGTADQFHFSSQQRSGDFDVRVRIEGLSLSDAWAKAGLMARETLAPESRFAAALATPSIGGAFFLARTSTATAAVPAGFFPVNYPETWLRLRRAGNVFTGYASFDGELWTQLGTAVIALSNSLYFGMAAASHDADRTTVVSFRDLAPVSGGKIEASAWPFEPLAACSRRSGLVISEIMYHPAPRGDGKSLEFIELFNTQAFDEDLTGHRLSGDIDFAFPTGTIMKAGAFLVVAGAPADLQSTYGLSGVLGPFEGKLPNDSGTIRLRNEQDAVLLEVNYGSRAPWPRAADGAGHSLVLAQPSYGEHNPKAWAMSERIGGTPGLAETVRLEPLRNVVINEILARSAGTIPAFIELHNHGLQAVDLSGSFLSDEPATNKFRISPGTMLAPRGFVSFTAEQLGFVPSAEGGTVYLVNSNGTRVLDAVGFRGQAEGIAIGCFPDGSPRFEALSRPTPGSTNSEWLIGDVVINEIMYHPISDRSEDEFVELHNRSTNAVSLDGWEFTDGIDFAFPPNAAIPAGGYLVVAKSQTNLLARYPHLDSVNVFGDFGGTLSGRGERLRLSRPDAVLITNTAAQRVTNILSITADEVTWSDGGRWGRWADGGGSSLELIDARGDHGLAPNWADSDESSRATNWTTIEHTGRLDLGNANYAANAVQVLLLGEGECLIDDIEVISGGNNLLANGTFESGTGGWLFEGNHDATVLETNGGFNSARSLRVRASGDGDCSANRLRASLTATIAGGSTATLRARVRWLRGHPEILLRLRGNWLEATGSLVVPTNLGTPGLPNSRAAANVGPAIYNVTHNPVLPAANQAVVVTARVHDPDGISLARLQYRVDPSPTFITIPMVDDGTAGDALAGDGILSASIPPQPAGALVAFYVIAADGFSPPATARFPDDAPARQCLIRFGESTPFGSFGTYRLWMTQATRDRWSSRGPASNQPLDCTFVNGSQRVVYNVGAYYTGSPFKTRNFDTPMGNPCDYNIRFPPDDRLLGATIFEVVYPGNVAGDDPTAQREQLAYWLARKLGLPFNARRYVNLFVNGIRRGTIIEDTQVPNRDVLEEVFPDDAEGELFKTAIWYEVDDVRTDDFNASRVDARMANFVTTGGEKKTARYRWNFQPHAVRGSANDFTNWFRLVDALNGPTAGYAEAIEAQVDAEQWMRVFALEHLAGQWDSFGFVTGANMFPYLGRRGRWTLLPWDLDIAFAFSYSSPGGDPFACDDPVLRRMNSHPAFRRAYWRALQDAVNGPLASASVNTWLDARAAILRANGLAVSAPDSLKDYINQERGFIQQQLASVAASFTVAGPALFSTTGTVATLTGTAPVGVATIQVNGASRSVTWTSLSTWTLQVSIGDGTNLLSIVGLDFRRQPVAGTSNLVTVVYTGPPQSPPVVFINEWMAANTSGSGLADPADGKFDDWFELYNPGSTPADLAGCFLTDNLAQRFQFAVPAGYAVAARGFLLVWADGETNQNRAEWPDLHTNFKLNKAGDAIGLFAPDGTLIDSVTFGPQFSNWSQGRVPDGAPALHFLVTPSPRATNSLPPAPPPRFTHIDRLPTGAITITWQATPGRLYRVEAKDSLADGTWTALTVAAPATTDTVSVIAPAGAQRQRFYRIAQAD
ncbi:MAG TPA: lamin tail domain-containing protein [Verrucomicrobiae bacterium]|nr:lamin tail domain-containing protein [Verrucomicrobiae bacterium]